MRARGLPLARSALLPAFRRSLTAAGSPSQSLAPETQPWPNRGDTMSTARTKYVRCLCDCESEPLAWLWPGRIAAGKLALIDGDPSQGKSLLTLDLVARLTTARPLPDGPGPVEPLSVVLIGTEDGLGDTVRPRLQAAGADLTRVHSFMVRQEPGSERRPIFPEDCALLR